MPKMVAKMILRYELPMLESIVIQKMRVIAENSHPEMNEAGEANTKMPQTIGM